MMKRFLLSFTAIFVVWLGGAGISAAQQNLPPDALVKQISDQVLEILRTDSGLRAGRTDQAIQRLEAVVRPHFDFRRMTMLAVGRDWRNATPEQKDRIEQEFYVLLVRTYSNALTQYSNQSVRVKPFRMAPGEKQVRVQTEVQQPGAQPVTVDYVMEDKGQGWKVFDVIVAGVSLVTNYRGNFAQEINANGIEGLIRALSERNRMLAQGQPVPQP